MAIVESITDSKQEVYGGKRMEQYSEQELDAKIHAFLAEKLQKYPELNTESKAVHTTTEPNVPLRLLESFTWFKSLATH